MTNSLQQNNQPIKVLELRNYLLQPNTADKFAIYFNKHFVKPMTELNGYTLGQFQIKDVQDRFVWLRGFTDMQARGQFLNDFYINSSSWKEFGPGANAMMINSDNVYLLRPLTKGNTAAMQSESVNSHFLQTGNNITVIDLYVCNSTLDKTIDLFNTSYLPFLTTLHMEDISLWVSEMTANDFPRLPVFQDKNLLVTISNYKNEKEYQAKQKEIDAMPQVLKNAMLETITTHSNLVLLSR